MAKQLYVIAGPNGAGKTTFAREFLPHFAHCEQFVNTDLVAAGLSPFSPGAAALQAGRLVLQRIRELASQDRAFGFETTLSGRTHLALFRHLKRQGYAIRLFYLWLPDVELAVQRVRDRVRQGGHSVPEEDIRRRFTRSLRHLWTDYRPLLDEWILFDNSGKKPKKIAHGTSKATTILVPELFRKAQGG